MEKLTVRENITTGIFFHSVDIKLLKFFVKGGYPVVRKMEPAG